MQGLFRGFLGFLVGSIILLIGVLVLDSQGYFNVKLIEVSSKEQHSMPAIARWSTELEGSLQEFIGASLIELPFEKIKDKIKPLDWVEDYRLHRKFPGSLQVELIPKRWIALFPADSGGRYLGLSSSCEVLPAIDFLDTTDLPLLSLKFKEESLYRKSLCELMSSLEGGTHLNSLNVNFVDYKDGHLVLQLIEPSVEIHLSKDQVRISKKRIERVLQDLEKKSLTPSVITAIAGQKVVVKLRKAR